MPKPKVLIAFNGINGYSCACWRALADTGKVDLRIVTFEANARENVAFSAADMVGDLTIDLLPIEARRDARVLESAMRRIAPDVIFGSGWSNPSIRSLYRAASKAGTPYVVYSDNPYRGTFRQKVGKYALKGLLERASFFVVPGERGFQLAKSWGIPESKIRRGLYGVDFLTLSECLRARRALRNGWPRRFLFVGRYHAVKGVDLLLEAYRVYAEQVSDPWELHCCGMGPLSVQGHAMVVDHGFVQPHETAKIRLHAGVGVLPSRSDAWPLAVVENAASGLPVLCTEACGSSVELVRDQFSGRVVATGEVESLVDGLKWFHDRWERLEEFGVRSNSLAEPYSSQMWASRHLEMIYSIVAGSS